MRIIGGKYRGRKLESPLGNDIRPTSDRVKENVFNSLQTVILGCKFLDLFSGSGAMGIEAVSRGAEMVFFSDMDTRLTEKNADGLSGNMEILRGGYEENLNILKRTGHTFDVIYIDPPFKKDYGYTAIELIRDMRLLNEGGVIVLEGDKPFAGQDISGITVRREKKYGSVFITHLSCD